MAKSLICKSCHSVHQVIVSHLTRAISSVFIDANKKDYLNYLRDVIGENGKPSLVKEGGLILVDNSLWKGLVLHKVSFPFGR